METAMIVFAVITNLLVLIWIVRRRPKSSTTLYGTVHVVNAYTPINQELIKL